MKLHQFFSCDQYIASLKARLEQDENSPKKYRRTIQKLFLELQKEGYEGSYDAVHHFVSNLKRHSRERLAKAYVPLVFEKGEAFQFDWSTESVILGEVLTVIKVAQVRLCYSRFFISIAYPNEELEMVMDAHQKAFEFFGSQTQKGIYDNMKTAVQKILIGKDRLFNRRFLECCSHYCFEPIACTPSAGWEKGQVENQVGTSRENFFSPLRKAENLVTLNAALAEECLAWAKSHPHPEEKDKTVFEMYEAEKSYLTAYRGAFEAYKIESTVVSAYCFVQYATNLYSVNCNYVEKPVTIRIYAHQIQVFYQHEKIAEHPRCFERFKKVYNPWHYVPLLERKPGALRNGAPFKELELPEALQKIRKKLSIYSDGDKQFIKILLEAPKQGLDFVNEACKKALEKGCSSDAMVLHYLAKNLKLLEKSGTHLEDYNQAYLSQQNQENKNHV